MAELIAKWDGHNSNSCVTGVNTTNTASTWALLTLPSASNLASGLQHSLVVTVHSSANSKVFLYGVDNINNVNGIRVEKLGSPGELAYDRNQIPATLWESELSSLGIGTFINMYSTNEQGANNGCANNPCRSLTQYYGDMQTLVQTEQAANSLADLIVASDPDTYGTVANNCGPMNNQSCTPIAQFEQQVNDLARNMGIGFVGVYSHIHPWNKLCFAGIGSCPASALNWYVSGDGKHLNNKGWDELAALYEAYLTDSYGPSFQWVSSPSNNALNPLRVFKNGVAQFEVNTGGIPVTIAGNTTVNNGVPGEIFGTAASYTFQNGVTGQQTPVNIVVPLVTGWYELNVEVIQTSVGSSCSGAASFAIQWNWTDGDTGFSITGQNNVSLWAANSGGTLAANSTASVSITTLDASKIWTSVARKIWAQAGGQISYTLNVTSNSLTCSAYPSIEIRPLVVAY